MRSVTDKDGRFAWVVTVDGYLRGKLGVLLAIANDMTLQLGANGMTWLAFGTVEGQLPLSGGGDGIDTRSTTHIGGASCCAALSTAPGCFPFACWQTAPARSKKLLDAPGYLFDTVMIAGKRQIFRTSKATEMRAQIIFSGNNDNSRLSDDKSALVYLSDRNGTSASYYQPVGGELRRRPLPLGIAVGEHLTKITTPAVRSPWG